MKPSSAIFRMPAWNVYRPPSAAKISGVAIRIDEKAMSVSMASSLRGCAVFLRQRGRQSRRHACPGEVPFPSTPEECEPRRQDQHDQELKNLDQIFGDAELHLQD